MNRLTHWGLPFTLAVFCLAVSTQHAWAQSAGKLFNQGRAAEARDDVETAYNDYARAYQKKPNEEKYKISWERLRTDASAAHVKQGERLRDQGDNTGALTEFLRALEIDPGNELASQDIRVTREKVDSEAPPPTPENAIAPGERKALQDLGAPAKLKPISNEPLTVHANDDVKVLYQTIGKLSGINVLFDPDYHSTRLQLDLANVDLYDALRILGTVSGTFWRPITANTIFVAQNTRGKRAELDEQAVQTFYLTNVSQQNDLNDIQTALRNIFTSGAKLYGVPSQNAIIMRGTPDELLLAGKLINDLDKPRPEVVVDVAVMEVSRTLMRSYGIQLPQTASINFQQSNALTGTTANTSTTPSLGGTPTPSTSSSLQLNQLSHINSTNFAVSIGQAQVNLMLSDARTKIIQNPRLRATDGQESSVRIGQRIPIATGSYQAGVATAITSSLVNTQFQYLDVGVNITMKPTVHYDGDVSMKLKVEVSSEGPQQNLGGITNPIINQQISEETIRVRSGEATVLSGILQHQRSLTISGYPGLGELPLLKYIFSSTSDTNTDDEIVFLLVPHIVRATDVSPLNLRQVDTGTTNDIELRHIDEDLSSGAAGAGVSALGAGAAGSTQLTGNPGVTGPGAQPPGASNPTRMPAGTIPGQLAAPAQAHPQAAVAPTAQAVTAAPVALQLVPSNPTQSVGNTFQEQVMLSGGTDVYSAWQQLEYDHTKLSLVNVDVGDILGRDGQAVALVHRDDGSGNVAISTSRPPGAPGITGAGTLCTLTFKATATGDASIAITHPVLRNSKQQPMQATGSQGVVHIK